jgi:hypothetical protein
VVGTLVSNYDDNEFSAAVTAASFPLSDVSVPVRNEIRNPRRFDQARRKLKEGTPPERLTPAMLTDGDWTDVIFRSTGISLDQGAFHAFLASAAFHVRKHGNKFYRTDVLKLLGGNDVEGRKLEEIISRRILSRTGPPGGSYSLDEGYLASGTGCNMVDEMVANDQAKAEGIVDAALSSIADDALKVRTLCAAMYHLHRTPTAPEFIKATLARRWASLATGQIGEGVQDHSRDFNSELREAALGIVLADEVLHRGGS